MSIKGRTLALDVGDAQIGVAISDPLGIIAQPLCSVDNKGGRWHIELLRLIQEHEVKAVVIGLPLELSGEEGPQARKVREFGATLSKALAKRETAQPVSVVFWDERLTTVQAERVIEGSGLKNRERRQALDRVAAAIILESYLNSLPR